MATRTWISNSSTNANLSSNYDGSGALLTTDDLVFDGTGSAAAIMTGALSVRSVTKSGSAVFSSGGNVLTINTGGWLRCSGTGSVTLSSNLTMAQGSTEITLEAGPTYTTTVSNFVIQTSAITITLGLDISISRLVANLNAPVITRTDSTYTLTIGSVTVGDLSGTEWKSGTPGTRYKVSYTAFATSAGAASCKFTDCNNLGVIGTATDATNIDGGNNIGWNIYKSIARVNPGVVADTGGGDSWTNPIKSIDRGSLVAASEVRTLASPDTNSGLNATWPANGDRFVSVPGLGGAVALIDNCESGWVVANGATISYANTLMKNGTAAKLRVVLPASTATSTKYAYKAITEANLSAFTRFTFWYYVSNGGQAANNYVIKLCSDLTGDVAVDTFVLNEATAQGVNIPLTINNSGSLGSAIRSIAIYSGTVAPTGGSFSTFDSFYACNGLCLNQLIHKPFPTQWAAATAYAQNDVRMPTFANGSYLLYRCSTAGTSGGSEPNWDNAVLDGDTITDGTCVWTCIGWNEAYFLWPIKSFQVATEQIEIDNHPANVGNAGRGFYGTQETTALWYITPYETTMAPSATTAVQTVTASGIDGAPTTIRGGYDTNDNVVGVTAWSGRNGNGYGLVFTGRSWIIIAPNLAFVRYNNGTFGTTLFNSTLGGIVVATNTSYGHYVNLNANTKVKIRYALAISCGGGGIALFCETTQDSVGCGAISTLSNGLVFGSVASGKITRALAANNIGNGIIPVSTTELVGLKTEANAAGVICNIGGGTIKNSTISESTEVTFSARLGNQILWSYNHDNTPLNHKAFLDGGNGEYISASNLWRLYCTNTVRTANYFIRIPVQLIDVSTAGTKTITQRINRSNTGLTVRLVVEAYSIAGVNADTYDEVGDAAGSPKTLSVTVSPTQAGQIPVYLYIWGGSTYSVDVLDIFGQGVLPVHVCDVALPAANTVDPLAAQYGRYGQLITPSMDVPDISNVVYTDTLRSVAGGFVPRRIQFRQVSLIPPCRKGVF